MCSPLVTRDEVQQSETEQLIDKMFGGSSELFFSAFLKIRAYLRRKPGSLPE